MLVYLQKPNFEILIFNEIILEEGSFGRSTSNIKAKTKINSRTVDLLDVWFTSARFVSDKRLWPALQLMAEAG